MLVPQVGVGVLIFRENRLLLGRRKGSHGAGCWSAPGGHLEFGESPRECARREVMEETGLTLGHIDHGPWGNDIFTREQKHYVTLFCIAQLATGEGEPENREPEKCEGWQWFDLHDLPQPLFLPLQNLLEILGPLADSRILIEQCGI